ncbi:hypothetical protein CROQUDRAFT_77426 [Cronartium quercuum f. sp. fusiforme G11]|uniref:histidine kinase n=1 Tax=Cronartium quercuum f. sp. fusiforme G11 TaxID=708437 RepID=A0A9P6TCE8_9BASI|nr:hypothetical protein CROQUDRAFT_77426 [Cronartium quercuum f. sp. fusiforme G11]
MFNPNPNPSSAHRPPRLESPSPLAFNSKPVSEHLLLSVHAPPISMPASPSARSPVLRHTLSPIPIRSPHHHSHFHSNSPSSYSRPSSPDQHGHSPEPHSAHSPLRAHFPSAPSTPISSITASPVPPDQLRSFFDHSPLPAFTIAAQPLQIALDRRFVGKHEDPEERGPIPRGHDDPTDFSQLPFEEVTYPHVTGEAADAGRDRNLAELLRTTWTNPAVMDLACRTLHYDLVEHRNLNTVDQKESSWDLMHLLGHRELARFLIWMGDLFKETTPDPSSDSVTPYEFRTELQCVPKYRTRWQTLGKKRANKADHYPSPQQSSANRPPSAPLLAEVIIVPTIVDCAASSATHHRPLSAGSSFFELPEKLSPDHAVLFTVTVLRQPPRRPTSDSPVPFPPKQRDLGLVKPTAAVLLPKRVKTSILISNSNSHPPTLHSEASLPLFDPLSQAAQEELSIGLGTGWHWLGEKEAKRAITRTGKRRGHRTRLELETHLESDVDMIDSNAPESDLPENQLRRLGSPTSNHKTGLRSAIPNFSARMDLDPKSPPLADIYIENLKGTNMGRAILNYPWEDTPIGPIEFWSPTLRSMVALMLSSPYRMSILWGEECVMLYNDAYVKTCGRKHPTLLGQSGAKGWAELWADLGEVANSVLQGDVYTAYDSLMFFDRDPENAAGIRKEECYHSFSWIPVRGPTGQVEGILNPSFETTSRVIAERRLGTLRDLVQITLISRNRASYREGFLESISKNPYDLPFAIMYTCESRKSPARKPLGTTEEAVALDPNMLALQLSLAGTVAVPTGHPSAPEQLEITIQLLSSSASSSNNNASLGESSGGTSNSSAASQTTVFSEDKNHVWPLQEACTLRKPIYIADLGTRAQGFEKRGWNDEPRSAVVMPVSTSEDAAPMAVIVFGLSPRLYWTEAYALFINLLTRQLSTGLSTVIGHEEEAQRLEDLAALDRAKTAFFANISHELRTPLTLIVGPIADILDSPHDISASARDRLKIVERNTQRLINQVNQLLDLSRFEAGRMTARFRNTDLSKLTADLASLFRSAMLKNHLELVVDCPASEKRVWVDHDFMEKVIFNLVSNSMKFTGQGGKVIVRVRFDATKCYLSVGDTGVGIKTEELPKIFDRFHRVEDSVQQAEGTGIGLALVQDIIKLHHGHLEVESSIGVGSTFTVTLFLGTSHLPTDSLDYSPETELEKINDRVIASNARRWMLGDIEPVCSTVISESSDSVSSKGSLDSFVVDVGNGLVSTAGSTILLADDNADMRSFVRGVLSRYFTVLEASNGLEAFHWAKSHRPDLVVSDLMMPGLDGFQLLKQLKADPDTAAISVILLSARAGSDIRVEGLAEGADDYLVKPFEAKELVARINTHLQLAKMRQRLENAVMTRTKLLKENEAKYRDLYHTFEAISMLSPVGIIQWSLNRRITFANNAFRSQCKLSDDGSLDGWTDLICLNDRERIKTDFEQNFEAQCTTKGEFRWVDGSWCLYELSPFYDENMVFAGCLGSTTDVTARKESERRQLEAAEARARDAEESKRQQEAFIDMTSHEIRNPLHGIHQAAELLNSSLKFLHETLEGCDGPISREQLHQIRHELEEDIDAVESIQLCASHHLFLILTDQFCLSPAQSKNVKLELQVGEGLEKPAYIIADPNRLAQVTINFLSNALRYTSNSDGRRVVTVQVALSSDCPALDPDTFRIGSLKPELADKADGHDLVYAKVGVQDTARGLSQDELANLFARFAQVNPTQDQYGGSGLGLYVSRCLIENHGGFIEVMSTKGQGSVFSFVIPAKRGVAPSKPAGGSRLLGMGKRPGGGVGSKRAERVEMRPTTSLMPMGSLPLGLTKQISTRLEKEEGAGSGIRSGGITQGRAGSQSEIEYFASGSTMPEAGKKTHVLVVEDNLINVKVIRRQLTLKGYVVSVAMDGRKALEMLYADDTKTSPLPHIDIVLMDIQMPVMNGLDAITELRAAEKTGTVKQRYPVIAVTGNARKEQMEQCLASGFDNICVKPYKIEDVQQRMEALLAACKIEGD